MGVLQRRFHKHDVHTAFSQPVEKHSGNAGAYRGKAMGTAILSRFPLAPYPMDLDDDVKMSSRFSDAVVKLGSGMDAYVCVVYAPPINNYTYADGEKFSLTPFCLVFREPLTTKVLQSLRVISIVIWMTVLSGRPYVPKDGMIVLNLRGFIIIRYLNLHAKTLPGGRLSWSMRSWPGTSETVAQLNITCLMHTLCLKRRLKFNKAQI